MSGKPGKTERCARCKLHKRLCLCDLIPSLDLATRLVVIMHHREHLKTSATASLALASLPNSALWLHGYQENPVDISSELVDDRRVLLLFPSEEARILTPELIAEDTRPVTLVVPDGNWRQASKMGRRIPTLSALPQVKLAPGPPSRYFLRSEPRAEGMATFEAIARAYGVLESVEVQRELEAVFEVMVRRTLMTRRNGLPIPTELL